MGHSFVLPVADLLSESPHATALLQAAKSAQPVGSRQGAALAATSAQPITAPDQASDTPSAAGVNSNHLPTLAEAHAATQADPPALAPATAAAAAKVLDQAPAATELHDQVLPQSSVPAVAAAAAHLPIKSVQIAQPRTPSTPMRKPPPARLQIPGTSSDAPEPQHSAAASQVGSSQTQRPGPTAPEESAGVTKEAPDQSSAGAVQADQEQKPVAQLNGADPALLRIPEGSPTAASPENPGLLQRTAAQSQRPVQTSQPQSPVLSTRSEDPLQRAQSQSSVPAQSAEQSTQSGQSSLQDPQPQSSLQSAQSQSPESVSASSEPQVTRGLQLPLAASQLPLQASAPAQVVLIASWMSYTHRLCMCLLSIVQGRVLTLNPYARRLGLQGVCAVRGHIQGADVHCGTARQFHSMRETSVFTWQSCPDSMCQNASPACWVYYVQQQCCNCDVMMHLCNPLTAGSSAVVLSSQMHMLLGHYTSECSVSASIHHLD